MSAYVLFYYLISGPTIAVTQDPPEALPENSTSLDNPSIKLDQMDPPQPFSDIHHQQPLPSSHHQQPLPHGQHQQPLSSNHHKLWHDRTNLEPHLAPSSADVLTRVPLLPISMPLDQTPVYLPGAGSESTLTSSSQTFHKRVSFQNLNTQTNSEEQSRVNHISKSRPLPPIGSSHVAEPMSPPGRRLPPLLYNPLGSSQDVVSLYSSSSYTRIPSLSGSTISLPVMPDTRYSRSATPSKLPPSNRGRKTRKKGRREDGGRPESHDLANWGDISTILDRSNLGKNWLLMKFVNLLSVPWILLSSHRLLFHIQLAE